MSDHPALVAAVRSSRSVVPLFVLDDGLRRPSGAPRLAFLHRCLRELDEPLDGRLVVRRGDPVAVVLEVAREVEATTVYASADFGPYGRSRDEAVAAALAGGGGGCSLERVDSPYAVDPGTLAATGGGAFKVLHAVLPGMARARLG